MKKNIHPQLSKIQIICNCGNKFNIIMSFNDPIIKIEVCNKCHPFYTGKQKIIDVAGRVDKFYKKFYKMNKKNK